MYIDSIKSRIIISCTIGLMMVMPLAIGGCDKSSSSKGVKRASSKGLRPPEVNFYQPTDYVAWLNAFLAKGRPAGSEAVYDGFWRYRGGEYCMPDPPEAVRINLYKLSAGPSWASRDYPRVAIYLADIHDHLNAFMRAANEPNYTLRIKPDPEYDCDPSMAVLPWAITGQYAICCLLSKSWMTGADQERRMLHAWQTGIKHSMHLMDSRSGYLIKKGHQNLSLVYRSIRSAIHCKILGTSEIENALALLVQHELAPRRMSDVFYSVWPCALGMIQSIYSKGRINNDYVEKWNNKDIELLKKFALSPNDIVKEVDNYYSGYIHIVSAPLSVEVIEKAKGLEDIQARKTIGRHPFCNSMFPPLSEYLLAEELQTICEFRATCLVLLLHKYYDDNGCWPNSLLELTLDEHQACTMDLFSGGEFHYQLKDDSFVLYSVGRDGKDDKGENDDVVYWPFGELN